MEQLVDCIVIDSHSLLLVDENSTTKRLFCFAKLNMKLDTVLAFLLDTPCFIY